MQNASMEYNEFGINGEGDSVTSQSTGTPAEISRKRKYRSAAGSAKKKGKLVPWERCSQHNQNKGAGNAESRAICSGAEAEGKVAEQAKACKIGDQVFNTF
jgi:hypothetical protein